MPCGCQPSDWRPLQCGHDPKAVENKEVWDRRSTNGRYKWLQCGHDPKAVENQAPCRDRRVRLSFWLQCGHDPKAVNDSTRVQPLERHATPGASMRPRPEGRGERTKTGGVRGQATSRFNRAAARKAVENERRAGLPGRSTTGALQCGHDPKAVENRPSVVGGEWEECAGSESGPRARRPWRG